MARNKKRSYLDELQIQGRRPQVVVLPDIQHVQQSFDWDCGIACVLMTMDEKQRSRFYSIQEAIYKEEGFGTSVWTIDLAYLLRRFNVDHIYYTITVGVNPDYKEEHFYRGNFRTNEFRVNEKFKSAILHDIVVIKKSLVLNEILQHIATGNPAIVLVNANLLFCDTCKNFWIHYFSRFFPFIGHFIIICGYDEKNLKIMYRNPSKKDKICFTSYENFERARRCQGTDEDIIFIFRP